MTVLLKVMSDIRAVKVRVFAHEGEDVLDGLFRLFPFSLDDEKILVKRKEARGFEEKRITIYEVALEKKRHIEAFLEYLLNNLTSAQRDLLLKQADSRLDEKLVFYVRLDKKAWQQGQFKLTDKGDCFHLSFFVTTYPRNRAKALAVIENIFKPQLEH